VYWRELVFPGEPILVRFDFKGEWYRCMRGAATNPAPYTDPTKFYYLGTLNGLGYPIPPGFNDTAVNFLVARPYQILRGPRRVGNPLELTGGACIDLAYCGVGPAGSGFPPDSGTAVANVQALTVMFTSAGGVEGIYVNNSPSTPQGTVHLLVGKVQKVNAPLAATPADPQFGMNMFDPENSNLADPTSLWVSISRSTGTVTTSENLPPSLGTGSMAPNLTYQYYNPTTSMNQTVTLNTGTAADRSTYLGLCRQIAIGRKQMGGR
jgi:hypothetical protein